MRRLLAALTLGISLLCPVALPVRAQHGTAAQQDNQTQTVYITRTGKYHSDGCRYLAGSKIAISLRDAKAKGYTACKVCHLPRMTEKWTREPRTVCISPTTTSAEFHRTLRVTPAMESKLTDHVWELLELLA
jgi:hypothetical protein